MTIGAITEIKQKVTRAWIGNRRFRRVAVLVIFDMSNAFNNLR